MFDRMLWYEKPERMAVMRDQGTYPIGQWSKWPLISATASPMTRRIWDNRVPFILTIETWSSEWTSCVGRIYIWLVIDMNTVNGFNELEFIRTLNPTIENATFPNAATIMSNLFWIKQFGDATYVWGCSVICHSSGLKQTAESDTRSDSTHPLPQFRDHEWRWSRYTFFHIASILNSDRNLKEFFNFPDLDAMDDGFICQMTGTRLHMLVLLIKVSTVVTNISSLINIRYFSIIVLFKCINIYIGIVFQKEDFGPPDCICPFSHCAIVVWKLERSSRATLKRNPTFVVCY